MKTLTMTLTFLAALPLALAAQVSKEDIRKLCSAGISDEVILSYVKANGPVAKLSAEDVIELKQAGASEKVLTAVLGAAAAPEYRPEPRTVEKQIYTAPTTTYVYDSAPYYYPYYSNYYYSSYYPRYYYSPSYCAPRYSYSSFYPSLSLGFYGGSRYCAPRTGVSFGVHVRK